MASLQLSGVSKSFGTVEVLDNINLSVADGEFVVFVGPSGCGKSTLLRIIAGLEDANAGTVSIDDEVVNSRTPTDRGIAMVFQTYALYPHLTVRDNMSLGLKQLKTPRDEIAQRVAAASEMLSLGDYLDRRPAELSGGQRQRVAIGRAIVRKPTLFLFDEPLSNLDASLRINTRLEIAILRRKLAATMVYVTHDQTEAMTLADRIVVLNNGRIEQIGTPMELYNYPANRFVAGFIGSPAINFLDAKVAGLKPAVVGVVSLGIRPEHISVAADSDHNNGASGELSGLVSHVEQLGGDTNLYLDCGRVGLLCIRLFGEHTFTINSRLMAQINHSKLHYFDDQGNAIDRQ